MEDNAIAFITESHGIYDYQNGEMKKYKLFEIATFKEFKQYVIDNYSGKDICNNIDGFLPDTLISLTDSGYLKNNTSDELLSKAKSLQVWEYLFKHQNRVEDIIEITEFVLVQKFIGNVFILEKENPFTKKVEDFLYIIENIQEENPGQYRLHLKDKLDPAIPIVKSKSLLNFEQLKRLNYVWSKKKDLLLHLFKHKNKESFIITHFEMGNYIKRTFDFRKLIV